MYKMNKNKKDKCDNKKHNESKIIGINNKMDDGRYVNKIMIISE